MVPLLRESIGILMQRTPPSLDHTLPDCYQRVSPTPNPVLLLLTPPPFSTHSPSLCGLQVQQLQGVYNLQEPHFWTLCTDVYIGTLKLLVAPDADARWILSQTHHIFTQVTKLTTPHPHLHTCP